jgi:hypothetical protein
VITPTSIGLLLRRTTAVTVVVCLLGTGYPGSAIAHARTNARVHASASGDVPADDHFLRDSIPATSFAAAQPDSTDDEFILPEEKDTRQVVKEIAVWVVAAAFVAFFIVKVFIEEDDEPADEDDGGKDIPPPQ